MTGIGGGMRPRALAWGLAHGAEVYVTSSSADKLAEAVKLGATAGFDYRDAGWVKQLKAAAGAIDIVIDSAGGDGLHDVVDTLPQRRSLRVLRRYARQCLRRVPEHGRLPFRQVRIQGTNMGRLEEFRATVACVNAYKPKPVVDHVYPFAEAVVATSARRTRSRWAKRVLRIA
ncbi:MAG: zinc-binding dehydrogenase [Proteobacteria bacterium]|nr:zinc-binding dehydrogenase [Pseudomonadota bacterium]